LFGLQLAAPAIKASGTAVVVEGYMDVLGPWQAGFRNVVATMGTSLTENHAGMLRRFARKVVLAMDPDAAGLAAAERAGVLFVSLASPEAIARSAHSAEMLAHAAEVQLLVAPLPPGRDPDELARDDPAAWDGATAGAIPYVEFLIARLMGPDHPGSPEEARRGLDRVAPLLAELRDPVEQGLYVQRIARHLRVDERAVLARLPARRGRQRDPGTRAHAPLRERSPEQSLLALLLRHPGLRHDLRNLPPELFTAGLDREVFQRWLHQEEPAGSPGAEDPVLDYEQQLQGDRLPPLSSDQARRAVEAKIREIGRERLIQRQAAVTEELAEAERRLGANRVAELSNDAWHGSLPPDDVMAVAETVIEELELGLSIHRREGGVER
jgi:DNA primase